MLPKIRSKSDLLPVDTSYNVKEPVNNLVSQRNRRKTDRCRRENLTTTPDLEWNPFEKNSRQRKVLQIKWPKRLLKG